MSRALDWQIIVCDSDILFYYFFLVNFIVGEIITGISGASNKSKNYAIVLRLIVKHDYRSHFPRQRENLPSSGNLARLTLRVISSRLMFRSKTHQFSLYLWKL